MNTSTFNRSWAKVILNAVNRYGVKHFCIAPGSRSTPLTLEALQLQQEKLAQCHSHFDERGLGFFALGIAKATKDPVAVIVTSGTAVANLYPAIIEASLTHQKLIVITADRPTEFIGCGVNQAIEQQNIFANYPIASLNLPKATENYAATWLVSTVENACVKQQQEGGVIHINAPFAEPLYDVEETTIANNAWLSPTLGWCLITDIQSCVDASLPYADIWLSNKTVHELLLQADIVIQFGSRVISKRVNQFLEAFKGEFWQVDEYQDNINPFSHHQTRFVAKAHHFLRVHPPLRQKPWRLEPLALSQFCTDFIEKQIGGGLNEASFAHNLQDVLVPKGNLFLGNSLFVRLVDALCKLPEGYPVYTNRGASGIDGLIATFAGIAKASEQTTVGVIGDISALHDLNSIALLSQINQPTLLFVINNSGGAIFDMLPVDSKAKSQFYRLSHNLEFGQIATMFGIEYIRPFTWADLKAKLKLAYNRRGVTLVEIKVNDQDGSNLYKSLIKQISQAEIA